MTQHISPNHREALVILDDVTGDSFYIGGSSSGQSMNVNATISGNPVVVGNKSNNTAAPGSNNLGVLPAVSTSVAPSYTEGNQVALSTDLSGALRVSGSISVGGTTDNSAFTAGSSTGTTALGFYHSTIDTVTDGRAAAVAITSKRAQHITPFDSAGTEIGTTSNPIQVSVANTGANATAIKVDGSASTQPISGTVTANQGGTWNITNISGTVSLPTGAATAAKQPALGTAGAASTDVITVQGIAAMTPLLVDGSGSTQPVSGTVTVTQATASNLKVDLSGTGANTTAIKVDGSAVTQPISGTVTANAGTGSFTVAQATAASLNATVVGTGTFATQAAQSGTWTVQPGNTANTTPWLVAPSAQSGAVGTAIYNNTALSNTKQAVNASAGNMYGYHIYNPNSSVVYVQLFNVASASVTVGTTAPTAVIAVPALGWADATPGTPVSFSTALTIAATTTSTGSTAPTTALLCNIWYK